MLQILLVEDNPADALLFQAAAEETSLAVTIVVFATGAEVTEYLTSNVSLERALVLLDLNLSMVSSLEVLETIRRSDFLKALPVVVMSGSCGFSDVDRAYRAGANSCICKPDRWVDIVSLVTQLVTYWSIVALPRNRMPPVPSTL